MSENDENENVDILNNHLISSFYTFFHFYHVPLLELDYKG